MTKEEKRRIKEGKKMAKLRAKEAIRAQKLREKEERRAAKEAKKHGRVYVPASDAPEEVQAPVQNSGSIAEEAETRGPETEVVSEAAEPQSDEEMPDEEAEGEPKKANRPKNYHVSLRDDGKWQVKFAKGNRALKLFDTQAEAIAFAKEKAENQDGAITIHKKDGKIRKQRY
ncbi:MAG: DUF2188 domain-containing protein [Christensenellales bacterium]